MLKIIHQGICDPKRQTKLLSKDGLFLIDSNSKDGDGLKDSSLLASSERGTEDDCLKDALDHAIHNESVASPRRAVSREDGQNVMR